MTTSISAFIQAAITIAKDDTLKGALPVLNNFFTSIQGNASTANLTAQAAALQVAMIASLPNLEQSVVHDLAALVQTEVDALIAQNTTQAAAASPAA